MRDMLEVMNALVLSVLKRLRNLVLTRTLVKVYFVCMIAANKVGTFFAFPPFPIISAISLQVLDPPAVIPHPSILPSLPPVVRVRVVSFPR